MAASAAASSFLPNAISISMTRPHATADTRLLHNLIKSEKTYITNLAQAVTSASHAAAALKAWGTSEARDVAHTSSQLADLLTEVAEAQANHLEAIRGYREALKDVEDREAGIRTIVKDRDILVSRLIKASKKKDGDMAHAQRELNACEEVLEAEERALVGVKRRTFKEALSMRMKTMGDSGNRMINCAKEAILLLDDFDSSAGPQDPHAASRSYLADPYGGEQDTSAYQHDGHAYNQHGQGYQLHDGYGGADQSYDQGQGQWPAQENGYAAQQHPSATHDQHYENASVTPSQSASQYGHVGGYSGQSYQQPEFAGEAPRESAEEREDSDASSERNFAQQQSNQNQQAHYNDHSGAPIYHAAQQAAAAAAAPRAAPPPDVTSPAPPLPTKDVAATQDYYSYQPQPNYQGQPYHQQQAQTQPDQVSQPMAQMHLATAPRFNYDGSQLQGIPQAPRLYNRQDEDSSDDEEPRNTTAHSGWGSRPTRGGGGDGDSSDGEAPQRGGQSKHAPQRPKPEKRNSGFLGRMGKLFKTEIGQEPTASPSGRPSYGRANSSDRTALGPDWSTRTDKNIKTARRENDRATGVSKPLGQSLMGPLAQQQGDESSSDDEEHRTDLVKHVNRPQSMFSRSNSDAAVSKKVGKQLRRTPSDLARITAGPMSNKQRLEMEQRESERLAKMAVMGAGIGSARPQLPASNSATSGPVVPKKKKKKPARTGSIAGSEVDTSATRRTAPTAASGANLHRHSSYIVPGDASTGHRGPATLVLPSDIEKQRSSAGYPSVMTPPTFGPSNTQGTLSRSSTVRTTGTTGTAGKKKKRASAVYDGSGTGLTGMSPRDGGKWTTNNWVPSHQSGLAPQAVANLGLVPHAPASSEEIARRQTLPASPPPASNASAGASISRGGTPLKSALKHPQIQQTAAAPAAPASVAEVNASLGPSIKAPPKPSDVMSDAIPVPSAPSLTAPIPVIAQPQEEEADVSAPHHLSQDSGYDGTGRLNLGMSRDGSAQGSRAGDESPLLYSQDRAAPQLNFLSSEPFDFDLSRLSRGTMSRSNSGQLLSPGVGGASAPTVATTNATSGHQQDAALWTPGEKSAYEALMRMNPSTPTQETAPAVAQRVEPESEPEPVQQPAAMAAEPPAPPAPTPAPAAEQATSAPAPVAPAVRPGALEGQLPSRTYSSEGKALHTPRSQGPPVSSLAPATAAAVGAPQSNAGMSDVSNTSGVQRVKSVRLAPDTKFPPETPPATAPPAGNGHGHSTHGHRVSDGFGGFYFQSSQPPLPTLVSITAPGSSLQLSNNPEWPSDPLALPSKYTAPQQQQQQQQPAAPQPDAYTSSGQLSSRIAPPPTAPPRVSESALYHQTSSSSPDRSARSSGWSTRIDRRLAANDDSSDEETYRSTGGGGGGNNGEEIDAYASARRAMGAASRHWSDAISPARKSKKKSSAAASGGPASGKKSTGGSTGGAASSSHLNAAGYNKSIPLPKGMEVVGRQKASYR